MLESEDCIAFKNVSVGYNKTDPIVSNLDFTLDKGQLLGIVGPIGSEKSTVINALIGEANVLMGTINCSQLRDYTFCIFFGSTIISENLLPSLWKVDLHSHSRTLDLQWFSQGKYCNER